MIEGAIYKLNAKRGANSILGYAEIRVGERRPSRTDERHYDVVEPKPLHSDRNLVETRRTTTFYEYDWIIMGDGDLALVGEDEISADIIECYDFSGMADAEPKGGGV